MSFTFIDLFAGIGGFRLAAEGLGGSCIFSSEWDKYARMTYAANFGDIPQGDIQVIDEVMIPDHDILMAGFPCQPFSLAGISVNNALGKQHGFQHTTQGTLFFDIARILKEKRPQGFILENVKNLVYHNNGWTFQKILDVLGNELGYYLHYSVINASHCVPQNRDRVYIVGTRNPIAFNFPAFKLQKLRLADIIELSVDERYTLTDKTWKSVKDHAARHQQKGNGFGYKIVDPQDIAPTLTARYYKDGSSILLEQKDRNPRRLTPRECARLMGFPDTYRIVVSDAHAYKQFGNSVVVPVVRSIIAQLVNALTFPQPLMFGMSIQLSLDLS